LGLLDFAGQRLHHQQVSGSVDRDIFVTFLDEFITRQQTNSLPRFIVLDNASIHHNLDNCLIDKWMCQYNTFLCYLPAYSPELNLIEIVWKHAKYHWRDFMTWVKDELPEKVAGLLDGYGNKFIIDFS
jgi:hypothetical protein